MRENLVAWNPKLSDRAKAHIEELRRDIAPQIAFVRQVRNALGLSQSGVAAVLGVTQSAVSKLEARDDASLNDLARLAAARGKRLRLVIESDEGDELSISVPAAA